MRISTTPNATPQSTPPSSDGSRGGADARARDKQFIFNTLVPRLVHPTKLAIIEALTDAERPLSVEDLTPLLPTMDGNAELIRYHAKAMVEMGALEVTSDQGDASADNLRFYLPIPS